jgi:hypothetical protein
MKSFLASISMLELFPNFQKEEIDLSVLEKLDDNQLDKLGLKMSARVKLMAALRQKNISQGFCFAIVCFIYFFRSIFNSFLFLLHA